jgi:hypothetical protein
LATGVVIKGDSKETLSNFITIIMQGVIAAGGNPIVMVMVGEAVGVDTTFFSHKNIHSFSLILLYLA